MLAIGVAVVALAWRPLAANLLELRAHAALARRDFDTASALLHDLVSRAPSGRVTFHSSGEAPPLRPAACNMVPIAPSPRMKG